MAQKSDVKLTVTPLPGVTVTGLAINFSAGAVPVCIVDVAPDEKDVVKIEGGAKGILAEPDKFKRKNDITVKLEVKSKSFMGETTRKLEWKGLFDGLTIGNTVGQNTYQAVLKGKAQTLLELTMLTPGLHPTSVNPYRSPFYALIGNANAGDDAAEVAWQSLQFSAKLNFDKSPIEFYKGLLEHLVEIQKTNYSQFLGNETTVDMQKALKKVLDEERYKKALTKAEKVFKEMDLTAVNTGSMNSLKCSISSASTALRDLVFRGPNVILENFMNFLGFMGCTLIFGSDNKSWVVPERSVIKQEHKSPHKKEMSNKPNVANPADYNSYSYNDNGYRDILGVIVATETPVGGSAQLGMSRDAGYIGWFVDDKKLTESSGVLIIKNHPFSPYYSTSDNNPVDAQGMKNDADGGQSFPYSQEKQYGVDKKVEDQKERAKEKRDKYDKALADVLNNYAETKFYQGRYGDRRGSITMDFNPKWCPGTGGTLYVRETKFFIDFWVESVTHRIDMSPPNGSTAITIINFCCGRMGTEPVGADSDKFLGYDKGKEKQVREAFVADIKANTGGYGTG